MFRPPYGKRLVGLPLYLARRGRPTVLWDLPRIVRELQSRGYTFVTLSELMRRSSH